MCHIFLVLSACESRLVTQFYKSNATSALVAGSKIYCYMEEFVSRLRASRMPKPYIANYMKYAILF